MLKTPYPNQRRPRSLNYSNQCQRELCVCENWKLEHLREEVLPPHFQNLLHSAVHNILQSFDNAASCDVLCGAGGAGRDVTTTVSLLHIFHKIHTSISLGLQDSLSTGNILNLSLAQPGKNDLFSPRAAISFYLIQDLFSFPWWTYTTFFFCCPKLYILHNSSSLYQIKAEPNVLTARLVKKKEFS